MVPPPPPGPKTVRLLAPAVSRLLASLALAAGSAPADPADISSRGVPFQSTEWNGGLYPAAYAVDGNPSTFSHTDVSSVGNRWELRLDKVYLLTEIRILSREDCCGGRLNGTTLRLLDEAGRTVQSAAITDPGPGEETTLRFPQGVQAKTVRIGFDGFATNPEGNRTIHLAEVTVIAEIQTGPRIRRFEAQPAAVAAGETVTLFWDTEAAGAVRILPWPGNEDPGPLPAAGSVAFPALDSREFALTAENADGVSRAAAAVIVDGNPLPPRLTEFLAVNDASVTDPEGRRADWVELHNPNPFPLSLKGFTLTDDPDRPDQWAFPALEIAGGSYTVYFAASEDGADPAPDRFGFRLSGDPGSHLALHGPAGEPLSVFAAYPEQRADVSYGVALSGQEAYFSSPTPGSPNGSGFGGFLPAPSVSRPGGFCSEAFDLILGSADPEATILFTTDGSLPAPGSPATRTYAGPLSLATTTVLRAAAIRPGHADSPVITHTYLFLDHVVRQPPLPAGFPDNWGDGPGITAPMPAKSDYAMDPRVVDAGPFTDAAGAPFTMQDALRAIPSLSLVMDTQQLFDRRTGIHANALHKGRAWERPISLEYFDTAGERRFGVDGGVRMQGGWNRHPESLKKSFRIYFRSDYGTPKLEFPLFADSAVDRFDTLVLRAGNGKAWPSPWRPLTGSTNNSLERTQYLRDQFARDTQRDLGQPSAHGAFVHLYINGLYWGLYNVVERVDEDFGASYFGGADEDYDVIKWIRAEGGLQANEGTLEHWNEALRVARENPASLATWENVSALVDLPNLIDYMLVNIYLGNIDWPDSNAYMLGAPAHGVPYRFFCWDAEETLLDPRIDRVNVNNPTTSAELYFRLRQNPEFRVLLADRIARHFAADGPLGSAACEARWMQLAAVIDRAIVAESARWGDLMRKSQPYTRDDWLREQLNLRQNYFGAGGGSSRSDVTLQQLDAAGLVSRLRSPILSLPPGPVPPGAELSIRKATIFIPGSVYYTLDGSDPRLPGGGISPSALAAGGPLPLTESVTVRARVFHQDNWGTLAEAAYLAGFAPQPGDLVVSEIHYHPTEDDAAEFLELENRSPRPLVLDGVQISGAIRFTFGALVLPAGERLLVVRDPEALSREHGPGLPIAGAFAGGTRLDNGGESLQLAAGDGTLLDAVSYDDEAPWPAAADGGGYSLTRLPETAAAGANPSSWRLSTLPGGSPGGSDSAAFAGDPLADTNGNGQADLLDHALGSGEPLRVLRRFSPEGEPLPLLLILRRNLAADDVEVTVQGSSDLRSWSTLPEEWMAGDTVPAGDGAAEVVHTAPAPAPPAPRFFRLRVVPR